MDKSTIATEMSPGVGSLVLKVLRHGGGGSSNRHKVATHLLSAIVTSATVAIVVNVTTRTDVDNGLHVHVETAHAAAVRDLLAESQIDRKLGRLLAALEAL